MSTVCPEPLSVQNPGAWPRRVLVVVSGESPQVVTETLYALVQGQPKFVPTRVMVITTAVGRRRAEDSLLAGGKFAALCEQYCIEGLELNSSDIVVPAGPDGSEDEDAHSDAELARMGDLMLRTVASFTVDAQCALHVSMAGGRKTMSFMVGQVMSLVARPQDRLSHVVLSDKRFEFLPEFFFPPLVPQELKVKERGSTVTQEVSTARVQIQIAAVPFLRLAQLLGPKALLDPKNARPLSALIEEANAVLMAPTVAQVEFNTALGTVHCNGQLVPFSNAELGFYYTLAMLAEQDRGLPRRPYDSECLEYLDHRSHVMLDGSQLRTIGLYEESVQDAYNSLFGVREFLKATRLDELTDVNERRLLLRRRRAELFNPQFTNVNRKLIESLGAGLAQAFLCISTGRPQATYFFPDGADIVWTDRRPRQFAA